MGKLVASLGILLSLTIFVAPTQTYKYNVLVTYITENGTTNESREVNPLKPPYFLRGNHTDDIRVTAESTAELNCSVAGIPKTHNITWYKDDYLLYRPYDWILKIEKFSTSDEGKYRCLVCNTHKCAEKNFNVSVKGAGAKPAVEKCSSLQNTTQAVNGSAVLCCPNIGIGQVYKYVVWIRTNSSAPENACIDDIRNVKMKMAQDPGSRDPEFYSLHTLQHEAQGWYTCVASRREKVICASAYLKVVNKLPGKREEDRGKYCAMDIFIGCAVATLFVTLVAVLFIYRERKKRSKVLNQWTKKIIIDIIQAQDNLNQPRDIPYVRIEKQKLDKARSKSSFYSEYELPRDDRWEFPRKNLKLGKTLGEGNFGRVAMAEALSISPGRNISTVAVKILKDCYTDLDMLDLVQEMEIMKMIGKHVNVLTLLGCCTQDGPLYVILEYAPHGNLRDFLRKHRPASSKKPQTDGGYEDYKTLSQIQLISFAHQITRGMEYLTSKRFIHRDLAARNVLVSNNYITKIADFGLARDINEADYYYKKSDGRLPVRWMAPETLLHRKYSSQSDVWSFGVLLWEIVSFGGTPYPTTTNTENLYVLLQTGYRMDRPPQCSSEVYEIMRDCWSYEPTARPTFSNLVAQFDTLLIERTNEDYVNIGVSLETPPSSFEESNFDYQP